MPINGANSRAYTSSIFGSLWPVCRMIECASALDHRRDRITGHRLPADPAGPVDRREQPPLPHRLAIGIGISLGRLPGGTGRR